MDRCSICFISLILLVLIYNTVFIDAYSHHIRHYRDRFKRQQGANLFLPGSYVSDSEEADEGPWQEWSTPSPCSRNCGGGVSTQYRSCKDGYSCRGATKRHFSCNTQDCADGGDFRAQQCAEFNDVPYNGISHQWYPYTKAPNPCELNCMPRGERFYYRHRLHVTDGTRCTDDKLDVCVEGKCQPVGCDMMLGSNAKEDKCRVCGGDGTTCSTFSGVLDMQDLQVGYNDILLIPAGAMNIQVRERAVSNNYLAVRNASGHYHLNGNWRIDFPRTLEFAGCKFHYERYPQGFSAPDSLTCLGPITERIFIVLLYQDRNVGVEYEYSVPQNVVSNTDNETYAWTFDPFTPCTSSCGGGVQYRNVTCAGRRTLEPTDPTLCDPSNRPVERQRCGEVPCDARWVTKPWSKCSAPCGQNGTQSRQIICEQIIANGVASIVDEEQCAKVPKPSREQSCNMGSNCAEWHITSWKPCDHLCGEGKETRVVTCYRKVSGKVEKLPDEDCGEEKPEVERACNVRPCEGLDWVASDWSGCDKCGLETETRRVQCATSSGKVYPDELCGGTRPETERKCDVATSGCDYEWYASQWSDCSAKCGKGVKNRKVFCASIAEMERTEDSNCDPAKKYENSTSCESESGSCTGEWFSGPWSKCSKECGAGQKTRRIICMKDDVTISADQCGPDTLPSGSEACNTQACSQDEILPVDKTKPVDVTEPTESTKEYDLSTTLIPEPTTAVLPDDEDEYEIVESEECEDGEWIDDDDEKIDDSDMKERFDGTMESSLASDDLMLGDAPDDGSDLQEGSGFSTNFYEGSGSSSWEDFTSTTDDYTGSTDPTNTEDSTPNTSGESTEATVTDKNVINDSTDSTEDYDEVPPESGLPDLTTQATSNTESTTEFTGSTESTTEFTGSTESTTEFTGSTESTTEFTGSTESTTEFTGSTESTTEFTGFTESTTEFTGSTESTTEFTGSTESTTEFTGSTRESESTVDFTGSTESITDFTGSTEAVSSEFSSESTTAFTGSTESTTEFTGSTESATKSTGSTIAGDTETTVDFTGSTESTTEFTGSTETTEFVSTQSTEFTGSTESATEITGSTEEVTTDVPQSTTESTGTTPEFTGSTEPTTEFTGSTKLTTEFTGSTEFITELTGSTVGGSTENPESTIEFTGSTEITDISTKFTGSTESITESSQSTTEFTGSTESTTEFIESTESTTEYTGTAESTTEFTGSTESTTVYTGSTESTTEYTGSTESTTEYTGSTESTTEYTGSTESTTEYTGSTESTSEFTGSTESTTEFTGSTETDINIWATTEGVTEWGTSTQISEIFTRKPKKCRRRKQKTCKTSQYGCCFDNVTPAEGPFDKGCPMPKTCKEAKYGCCEDGVSMASGKEYEGCPASHCDETLFGCCWDKKTPADGENEEGCPPPPPKCLSTKFGCCKDNATEALGPEEEGCVIEIDVNAFLECSNSTFGCCPDGQTPAQGEYFKGCDIPAEHCADTKFGCCSDGNTTAEGPNFRGCQNPCSTSNFGCCEDGITPAHGYSREGCCLSGKFGCCPDNIIPATGPEFEGCGCQYSLYKCCPDNKTAARGPNNEGCGCQHTESGCCPDSYTPAAGPDYQGCLCHTFQFGCCPDGVAVAKGPHQQGCGCQNTQFGCCSDNQTPATGTNMEGCGCASSKYGCCPDGATEAKGTEFLGCEDVPINQQAACSEPKERGTCRNYTVKWFYDMEYGGCSRFWYGGCDGNSNRFKSQDECKNVCVEPAGKERCKLPKVSGPCEGYYRNWYYDKENNYCSEFNYGGCLGNNNRFETRDECTTECVVDTNIDACEQPREEGPCRGQYLRWYYNNETSRCEQFYYGGCKANSNNFPTEMACKQQCSAPNRKKDHCSLPRAQGNCTERIPKWYYDATEKRCMPFYYSGCDGNTNNFVALEQCEADCPQEISKDTCQLAAETGECSDYVARWYYDTKEKRCLQFYYGGCGGNGNNFLTDEACAGRCDKVPTTEPPVEENEVSEPFKIEDCFLANDAGPCRDVSETRWYYDATGVCLQFLYGGCQGNKNNFKDQDQCRKMCGNAQDLCSLPKVVGPCNAEFERYHYDNYTDSCLPFTYGGCLGNDNRFDTIAECQQRCQKGPVATTQVTEPTTQAVPEDSTAICFLSMDTGTCNESLAAFYYNAAEQECVIFTYSGCGGNANRYTSEEQCERQCGLFRGQDVCKLPLDVGPCRASMRKVYYDRYSDRCQEFHYGGCEGNGNRFSSLAECQSICVLHEETKPNVTSSEICRLPMDVGACDQGIHKRWYFDESRGECIAFIYTGCGGNFNRFTSFKSCVETCREFFDAPQNEIDAELEPESEPEPQTEVVPPARDCSQYTEECRQIRCPYGMKATVDDSLCNRCTCINPCEGHECVEGEQCAVDINTQRVNEEDEGFIAVCRQVVKPGRCPELRLNEDKCTEECRTDADCTLDMKCCSTGCGTSCVNPHSDAPAELVTAKFQPAYTEPPAVSPGDFAPLIDQSVYKPEVMGAEGDVVILTCAVRGNPNPRITWSKDNLIIDGFQPRYRMMFDGNLQIITLHRTDSGIYICSADNGIGHPLRNQVRLNVTDGKPFAVRVLEVPDESNIVSLGSPARLRCYALGFPFPQVTWWRNESMIPLKTTHYELQKDYSLLINQVQLEDLGLYTCQAYNGIGKATSWTVTVMAQGPVYSNNPEDQKYMKYIVDQPKAPEESKRVQYPYRPQKVVPVLPPQVPSSTVEPVFYTEISPEIKEDKDEVPDYGSTFVVPVKTEIKLEKHSYGIGSDVSIPCNVDGHPTPEVAWYKDEERIEQSEHFHISESHRLTIRKSTEKDTGIYKCEANNRFSSAFSAVNINIEGIYLHPGCTDNQFFANCALIVKAKFCTHKYYAKFCCKSCTLAGLLPSSGPHLY